MNIRKIPRRLFSVQGSLGQNFPENAMRLVASSLRKCSVRCVMKICCELMKQVATEFPKQEIIS